MDLFFASNIFFILKSLNVIFIAGLIFIGLRKLQRRPQKITFTVMLLFFLSSTLFFNHEGALNEWLKHSLFYSGQLFFSFFLYYIIRLYFRKKEQEESSQERPNTTHMPPPAMTAIVGTGTINWFAFLTEQGLQHILVVPIYFLIVSIVRIQYLSIESRYFKKNLNLFLWAGSSLAMIHIAEFFIENQKFIPFLNDKIELIEFLLFYLGLLFFYLGMRKLS